MLLMRMFSLPAILISIGLIGFNGPTKQGDMLPPSDPNVLYVGRFDWTDATAPTCEWPASEVRLRVKGKELVAYLDDASGSSWQVAVDNQPAYPTYMAKGEGGYTIELGGEGEHDVRLVRRVEAFMGPTKIKGFIVPHGKLLKAKPKKHHIEVVGDSITCGYGNEASDQHQKFKPETENAYLSYASIGARMLDADVTILAWSGRKMWPDNSMPDIYDLVLPTQPTPVYDFKGPVPEVVVINLATNDFGQKAPDEAGWTAAYEAFCKRVWSHYPKAQIYAATGSMMFGPSLETVKSYLAKIETDLHDKRFHRIDFDPQDEKNGLGADWHPSVKTDQIMGEKMADVLSHDLKWSVVKN